MASRATEFFRIVNLKQFFARMTNESVREFIRLFAGTTRSHVGCFDDQRFARAQVANFTTIDKTILINVNLMTQNGVIKSILVLAYQFIYIFSWQQADVVLKIIVALLCQLSWLFQQLSLLSQNFRFFIAEVVERLLELGKVHLLANLLPTVVRQFDIYLLLLLGV